MKALIVITEIAMPIAAIFFIIRFIKSLKHHDHHGHDDHGHGHGGRDLTISELFMLVAGSVGAPAMVMSVPNGYHVFMAILFGLYFVVSCIIMLMNQPATKNISEVGHRHWTEEDIINIAGVLVSILVYLIFGLASGTSGVIAWTDASRKYSMNLDFLGTLEDMINPVARIVILVTIAIILFFWIRSGLHSSKADHHEKHDDKKGAAHAHHDKHEGKHEHDHTEEHDKTHDQGHEKKHHNHSGASHGNENSTPLSQRTLKKRW